MKDRNQPAAPPAAPAAHPTVTPAAAPLLAAGLSRRMIFGTGLVGVATLLAQACSGGDFASGNKNGRKKGDGGTTAGDAGGVDAGKNCTTDANGKVTCTDGSDAGGADGNDGADSGGKDAGGADSGGASAGGVDSQGDAGNGGVGNGVDDKGCHANTTTKLDVTGLQDAGDDLKPRVVFYGRPDSTMIALKLPSGKDVKQVIITRDDGSLLALHGITPADMKGTDYRPIVIDNLNLGATPNVHVVIQLAGTDRKKHTQAVAYFTSYPLGTGKPVVDLSAFTVPADWMANQSVTQFAEVAGSFNVDAAVTYPSDFNPGKTRALQTAKQGTSWVKQGGVKGVVTDVMGDVINIDGAGIIEYQVFCTYVDVGAKVYRTILQIG
jgi:hypothetical protein